MTLTARPLNFSMVMRIVGQAFGLAFGSALSLAALLAASVALGAAAGSTLLRGALMAAWFALVVLAHGAFVAWVTDHGLRLRFDPGNADPVRSDSIAWRAALPLSLPLIAAVATCWFTGNFAWSMAGWALLVATALPARTVCWLRGQRPQLGALDVQVAVAAITLLPIALSGLPLQTCEGECWGMMEGGIVAMPLLGGYLFFASTSAALLSVIAVRAIVLRGGEF